MDKDHQYVHCSTRTVFTELIKRMSGWEKDYCENDILDYWDKNRWWDYGQRACVTMKVSDLGKGDVVAGCAYKVIGQILHIKRLFTSTNYRKQGHAKDLLEYAWRSSFVSARFLRMYCDKDAIPFYTNFGFRFINNKGKARLTYNKHNYGYVLQPMLFRDMGFTLKHCKSYKMENLLDEQDKTFIKYDFI